MTIELEVRGLREATRKMDKLAMSFKDKRKLVDKATKEAIKIPVKAMRQAAPKDTGTLKRAIRFRKKKGRQQIIITHGKGQRNDAWYWKFVEFGFLRRNGVWQSPVKFLKRALGRTRSRTIIPSAIIYYINSSRTINIS